MQIVVIGLTITSSWGNGHATTYRALLRAAATQGHDITFLEHDKPWYASNRDLPEPPFCRMILYESVDELKALHHDLVRDADAVIVGSYVPEGIEVGDWARATADGIVAFYDIDTPVTLAKLEAGTCDYLAKRQISAYDLYLSFTGGPTLVRLQTQYGSPAARALYCSVDPDIYRPDRSVTKDLDLGYLGTYSMDRQPPLERLLTEPARLWPEGRFLVAGPQYPEDVLWPANVQRTEHLPPAEHPQFYNRQRFTLNITRADMVAAGWSPSVRLFEAGACGTPLISDPWEGLDQLFADGTEICICRNASEVLALLRDLPAQERMAMGEAFRARVLREHTADIRASELLAYLGQPVRRLTA